LRSYLENYRVVGEQIFFVDPEPVTLDIVMTVVLAQSATMLWTQRSIREILDEYTYKLSSVFHVGEIYKRIQELPSVLRLYVEQPTSDYSLSFNQYLVLPENLFESSHIRMVSGNDSFVDLGTTDGYV
jgi:hypothetical protein